MSPNLLLLLLSICLLLRSTRGGGGKGPFTAISIFRPEESELHKYSAVLAATEPFRLRCDSEIKRAINPVKRLYYKLRGVSLSDPSSIARIENKAVDVACARYEQRVDDILKCVISHISHGFSAPILTHLPPANAPTITLTPPTHTHTHTLSPLPTGRTA